MHAQAEAEYPKGSADFDKEWVPTDTTAFVIAASPVTPLNDVVSAAATITVLSCTAPSGATWVEEPVRVKSDTRAVPPMSLTTAAFSAIFGWTAGSTGTAGTTGSTDGFCVDVLTSLGPATGSPVGGVPQAVALLTIGSLAAVFNPVTV